MRTHLSYITVIAALLFFFWMGYKTLQKKKEQIDTLQGNISALIADTTEKASVLKLAKSELAQVSPKAYDKVKSIEDKQGGKVREIHVIKYLPSSVVHDTVFIAQENVDWCCKPMVWEFNHGCVTNVVTYDPFNLGITDSLFGEVSIDRYVLAQKPRWIVFKPRMWNSRNWPTSVRVENNCGLEIKENTIFEFK